MTSARQRSDYGRCGECGHKFYNDWESYKHSIGVHHYRAWTEADAAKKAEESGIPRAHGKPKP